MRHGQSIANLQSIIVSAPENAINGYGLTATGCDQVTQAALETDLGRDTLIVTSDYKRALETAQIMQRAIGSVHPLTVDTNLRERYFGNYELQSDRNYEQVWMGDGSCRQEVLEEVETVEETLTRALKSILSLESEHNGKTILLVGHGDVMQILLAHHNNIKPKHHRSLRSLGNADIRPLSKLKI